MHSDAQFQQRLNDLGYDAGPVDGDFGKRSKRALAEFQKAANIDDDGTPGKISDAKLFADDAPRADAGLPDREAETTKVAPAPRRSLVWPLQRDCTAFFGPPASDRCSSGLCRLPFPFRFDWDRKTTTNGFHCHEKVASSFEGIFADAARMFGRSAMQDMGLDLFSGCYNPRRMRGGSAWSMHAWGIAVDLDPGENGLHTPFAKARFGKPEYEPWWKIVESYGAVSLGRACDFDSMHFQFARVR